MFSHDVLSHVPGFVLLSRHPSWPRLKKVMRKTLRLEEQGETGNTRRRAVMLRYQIAGSLESFSQQLTLADQSMKKAEIADRLLEFDAFVAKSEGKLKLAEQGAEPEPSY